MGSCVPPGLVHHPCQGSLPPSLHCSEVAADGWKGLYVCVQPLRCPAEQRLAALVGAELNPEEPGLQGEILVLAPSWSPAHGWEWRILLKALPRDGAAFPAVPASAQRCLHQRCEGAGPRVHSSAWLLEAGQSLICSGWEHN